MSADISMRFRYTLASLARQQKNNWVTDVTRSLVNKNHVRFVDNFLTSLRLLRQLKSEGIDACGSYRIRRLGLPDHMKSDNQMKRGVNDWRITSDGISFTKWVDKRLVCIASNFHDPFVPGIVDRKKKNGK